MNNFNWKGGSDNGKESNDNVEISKKSQAFAGKVSK